jgi:DNA replication protein DnaC
MTDDNYKRRGGPARLGDLVEDVTAWLPKLTDAQWADRDAVVAEAKRRQEAADRQRDLRLRATMLRDCGFGAKARTGALAAAGGGDGDEPPLRTKATDHALAFVKADFGRANGRNVLILAGGTGAGKTTAATLCALLSASDAPALIRAGELERRGRYDRDFGRWLDGRSLLVLDDLGTEPLDGKGYFVALLDELVDRFCSDEKPLIVTTNLAVNRTRPDDQPQITERYEARVVSRMLESATWAACGNDDLRRGQR